MSRYTFGKKEKLCSKLVIDALFKSGKSFKEYPIRVMYMPLEESDATAKLLITVPKKRFKKAVSRNKVKRLIRETYRLNKPELFEELQSQGKYFAFADAIDSSPCYTCFQIQGQSQGLLLIRFWRRC